MAFSDWARVETTTPSGQAEVGGRRIYILPTRYGWVFGALLFLMLLGSVNYGNNPAHLLTFLLAGLGGNAIYQTWRNLRGLRLQLHGSPPVFAGQNPIVRLAVDGDGRERPAIQADVGESGPVIRDLNQGRSPATYEVTLPALPRGLHRTGRLRLATRYPLGIFCAWCYVETGLDVLVYPRPGPSWQPAGIGGDRGEGLDEGMGSEDFYGLRGYVPGDQRSRIDWKSYARDRGLNTRLFSGQANQTCWLRWEEAPGNATEPKLSALTRAVLDAESSGLVYGLKLPGTSVAPGSGTRHRHRCLRELSLYGTADA